MNSLCQMQQTTTKKSNGTLGLAQIYDIEQLPNDDDAVQFDMDYSVDMIQEYASNHHQYIQELLRNNGIGCLLRKKVFGMNYQKHPRITFWLTPKHPISLLLVSLFMM